MSYSRSCYTCPHAVCGEPNGLSDWCDECQEDPDTGFGGFTDHSYKDEYEYGVHFNSQEEADSFYGRDTEDTSTTYFNTHTPKSNLRSTFCNFIDSRHAPMSMWD